MARAALDAALPLRGQLIYVNGAEQARIELKLPAEVPYCFACLPRYAQDADGVTSRLRTASGGEQEVRSRFLVGCDGAHSGPQDPGALLRRRRTARGERFAPGTGTRGAPRSWCARTVVWAHGRSRPGPARCRRPWAGVFAS
ncbi:FAD-dependent monooxygenase [Streptomyces sp. NPDC001307]|uniref:FAD-dependent monooxygenase n=1 Tax=Streptomyces sp. NPDC001307 TaxID=3364560 RepID=UPI0036847311